MGLEVAKKTSNQINWINCAKFLAIFAVLVDHTNGVLYSNQSIACASYYSVSLFVIISGYLCYSSNARISLSYGRTIIKSCKKIVLAYLLATFIYTVVLYRFFDIQVYLDAVLHFSAAGPFYYVSVYVQLMIVNRAIYKFLEYGKKYAKFYECAYDVLLGTIILAISSLTTCYTNILAINGGGGKLFGGTYLFVFYMGMILNKYKVFDNNGRIKIVLMLVISIVVYICLWRLLCKGYREIVDSKFCFGEGFNPPSVTLFVFALSMLFLCYGFFNICEWSKFFDYIPTVIGWLGKHTLYIFLYHFLWMIKLNSRGIMTTGNIHIKRSVYILVLIFASIALEYLVKYMIEVMIIIQRKVFGIQNV